ncbi:MAG: hypothetical protein HRU29_01720 [Rhizobiales bacterium]|nr:hypothetical protein [Hyphomicrobiales bacterium]NRB13093.1 hypothetical protein [Hyphomicrobiales bacterium]
MGKVTKKAPKGWGTVAEYAIARGCSRQSANRFVTKYEIQKKGKWVEFAAIDTARNLEFGSDGKPVVKKDFSDTARLTRFRADKMATSAASDELKYRALQGELIRRSAIVSAAQTVISTVRQEMIALPSRLTPQLAACGEDEAAINEVLTEAVNEVMTSLYELSKIKHADRTTNN